MKERLMSVFTIGGLLVIIVAMCVYIGGIDERKAQNVTTSPAPAENVQTVSTTVAASVPVTAPAVTTILPPVTEGTTAPATSAATETTALVTEAQEKAMPESTKEIIDKYTQLVNNFKEKKPAYKKKEFQALPEEYREFGSAVNVLLGIASNYMVTEEECEELVREAGSGDIVWDMPVHNTEKGCVLTDYDAVLWAKCEDMGDGTYKISFSLKEEINPQPTSAETLVPVSAHGAVMQPIATDELMTEINKITSSVPGIGVNDFSLYHRDCEFICVYNPETDEVLSITHHIVIDIAADIKFFMADINGSARLLNEMFIYDITW
ncbi:MAG: hypothetical protein IJO73_06160 [Clostridia bacterium]|nr:hypothetical protein [Clostridia bacterium]